MDILISSNKVIKTIFHFCHQIKDKIGIAAIIGLISITLICSLILYVSYGLGTTCRKLHKISNNKAVLVNILNKVSFFNEDPQFLSKYREVSKFPYVTYLNFHEIKYSLGIDWRSLGIPPVVANFSFQGREHAEPLNYANLKAQEISSITIGVGARHRLVFVLKDELHDFSQPAANLIEHLDIQIECGK